MAKTNYRGPDKLVLPLSPVCPGRETGTEEGFTTMEMAMTVATVLLMFALAIPAAREIINETRANHARTELEEMQDAINEFLILHRRYPDSLAEIYGDVPLDPWGNRYVYLKISGGPALAMSNARKGLHLGPVNTDYDLYSLGADGVSVSSLTGKASRDDIIRANNGLFIGDVADLTKKSAKEMEKSATDTLPVR